MLTLFVVVAGSDAESITQHADAIREMLLAADSIADVRPMSVLSADFGLEVRVNGPSLTVTEKNAGRVRALLDEHSDVKKILEIAPRAPDFDQPAEPPPEDSKATGEGDTHASRATDKSLVPGVFDPQSGLIRRDDPQFRVGRRGILAALYDNDRALSLYHLGDILEVMPHTVGNTIKRLIEAGLVERTDGTKGRKTFYRLTELGRSFGPDFEEIPSSKPKAAALLWGQRSEIRSNIVRALYRSGTSLSTQEIVRLTGAERGTVNSTMLYGERNGLVSVGRTPSVRGVDAHTYMLTPRGQEAAKLYLVTTVSFTVTIAAASPERAVELSALVRVLTDHPELGELEQIAVEQITGQS